MRVFVVRDLCLLLATTTLWALDWHTGDAWQQALLGGMTGLLAYESHEWGHYLGARLGEARIDTPSAWWSPFLFGFDPQQNSRRAFVQMTWPGFVATLAYLGAFAWLLPNEGLTSAIAWAIATLLAGITLFVEVPILLWGLSGRRLSPRIRVPLP
ncbi:MAG: hypothetical protein AAF515_14420 [Pseudomonadota bacterium]